MLVEDQVKTTPETNEGGRYRDLEGVLGGQDPVRWSGHHEGLRLTWHAPDAGPRSLGSLGQARVNAYPLDRRFDAMTEARTATDSPAQLAGLVAALIEHDLVACDDWVHWATEELLRADGAPPWLAELTTTYSMAEATVLLASEGGPPSVEERLGCLWLASDSDGDVVGLLEKALEIAGGWDTGGGFIPHQRDLMKLLDRCEEVPRRGPEALAGIKRDAAELLIPLAQRIERRTANRIRLSRLSGLAGTPPADQRS